MGSRCTTIRVHRRAVKSPRPAFVGALGGIQVYYHPCPQEGSKESWASVYCKNSWGRSITTHDHRRAVKRLGPAFIAKIHGQQVYCHSCPQEGSKEFWTSIYYKKLWAAGALPPMFTGGQ